MSEGERRCGVLHPQSLQRALLETRGKHMQLCDDRTIDPPFQSAIMSMSVDHVEDRYMLVGYANGGVAIIDVSEETVKDKKFECALRIPQGQAHDFGVTSLAWYTRDTGLFVSGGFDEVVKIWDTNKAEVAIEYKTKGKVYDIDVHKTSTLHNLVAAANGHVVSLYDANSGLRQHSLRGHQGTVNCVAWSVCEQYQLFSGGSDGTVVRMQSAKTFLSPVKKRLWDVRQGASCLAFLSPEGKPWTSRRAFLALPALPHKTCRKRRRTEHDGTASSSSKGDEAALLAHAKGVSCLRFTPDGRYLLSSGGDERVRLWNPVSCELEIVNYGAFPQARAAAYKKVQFDVSWSGKLLFHPCQNEVVVCDLASGNRISRLRGHVGTVKCCVAKPRGEDLFSGDQDANILVWTPNDRQVALVCPAGTDRISRFLDGEEEVEVDVDNWSDSD
ncbi:hypothetical protein GUITHDRAFT_106281 [Guillardia theta CCMP2712]|uniref:Anaphase-promoting complex subunit 4 WD40 domain-containing protein n=1 Tax=Guillardia theta (strain CCMP2712) TaxID=905079 RepID=L1JHV8_GUITC|nr:hypothetical protein GUITHDRAFT_106281 [Guillardia theta CCMP2712]EKX47729.1 hypothetical protein GUITHDRAFT_106281 [Guillardia theta CCMP2712]|eukprot:XP_005834709.1 hypothetical protein GUITHDRAFT_106281 [Guillardia theta CCMP2712]